VNVLATARNLNPADTEIPYLLGLGLLSTGQADEAALNFAVAQALGGPVQSNALEQL
jgi:hypothetical protein